MLREGMLLEMMTRHGITTGKKHRFGLVRENETVFDSRGTVLQLYTYTVSRSRIFLEEPVL